MSSQYIRYLPLTSTNGNRKQTLTITRNVQNSNVCLSSTFGDLPYLHFYERKHQ